VCEEEKTGETAMSGNEIVMSNEAIIHERYNEKP